MTNAKFAALHHGSEPMVLFNIWDAGSAKAVAAAGAQAVATGSLSLAGAQGYDDGEALPFEALLETVRQIAAVIDVPLSVDIETGYADSLNELAANARALVSAGVVGCNLEDQVFGAQSLRDPHEQADRIAAVSEAGLFVNARTDLFLAPLMAGENPNRADLVGAAIHRASIYKKAGAGCFFAPGLSEPKLTQQLCQDLDIPINLMRLSGMPSNAELGALGVRRISHGPGPWRDAMAALGDAARHAFSH